MQSGKKMTACLKNAKQTYVVIIFIIMDLTTEVELNTKQSNAIDFQAFIDKSYQFINDF